MTGVAMIKQIPLKFPIEARLFLQAYKTVNAKVDKDLRSVSPLSATEFEVLWRLAHNDGRMRFIALAHEVKLSQSRVSRQIDSLQVKGYALRESTGSNRRATFAVITELGKTVFEAAEQPFQAAWRTHFLDCIESRDRDSFRRSLESLIGDIPLPP
jgi:DNA-binding MarR family transcriptional regulator